VAREPGRFTIGLLQVIVAIFCGIFGIVALFTSSPGLLAWFLAIFVMPFLLVILGQLLVSVRLTKKRNKSARDAYAESL
jgi:hypothetical protein